MAEALAKPPAQLVGSRVTRVLTELCKFLWQNVADILQHDDDGALLDALAANDDDAAAAIAAICHVRRISASTATDDKDTNLAAARDMERSAVRESMYFVFAVARPNAAPSINPIIQPTSNCCDYRARTNTSSPPETISPWRRKSGSWGTPLSVADLTLPQPTERIVNVFPPSNAILISGYALPCMI